MLSLFFYLLFFYIFFFVRFGSPFFVILIVFKLLLGSFLAFRHLVLFMYFLFFSSFVGLLFCFMSLFIFVIVLFYYLLYVFCIARTCIGISYSSPELALRRYWSRLILLLNSLTIMLVGVLFGLAAILMLRYCTRPYPINQCPHINVLWATLFVFCALRTFRYFLTYRHLIWTTWFYVLWNC